MNMKSIHFPSSVADEMIRAILGNRKTVTRRVVKPKPLWQKPPIQQKCHPEYWANWDDEKLYKAPYCSGNILYVRETWQYAYDLDGNEQPIEGTGRYLYAADRGAEPFVFWVNPDGTHRDSMPWRPSIHMPHEAARIFLRVTDVRAERLRPMGLDELEAEGIDTTCGFFAATEKFADIWDSTIKPKDRALYGWEADPWVWVIEFERISREEAMK